MSSKRVGQLQGAKPWLSCCGVLAILWSYWPNCLRLSEQWAQRPEYSHGFLVPLIAVAMLHRRLVPESTKSNSGGWLWLALPVVSAIIFTQMPSDWVTRHGYLPATAFVIGVLFWLESMRPAEASTPSWWGFTILLFGISLRLFAARYSMEWVDHISIIPTLAGVVLLYGGLQALSWSWPAILFLGFMIPLPHTAETMLRGPLRKLGTIGSTFVMQFIGLPAFSQGNQNEIVVGEMTRVIGVNEACSGLSMLMVFFAVSTAAALLSQRTFWEKSIIVASAIPIALFCNIIRISTTGVMLYELDDRWVNLTIGKQTLIDLSGPEFASTFFHDWAGWLMVPLALLLLWCELKYLGWLIVLEEDRPVRLMPR